MNSSAYVNNVMAVEYALKWFIGVACAQITLCEKHNLWKNGLFAVLADCRYLTVQSRNFWLKSNIHQQRLTVLFLLPIQKHWNAWKYCKSFLYMHWLRYSTLSHPINSPIEHSNWNNSHLPFIETTSVLKLIIQWYSFPYKCYKHTNTYTHTHAHKMIVQCIK